MSQPHETSSLCYSNSQTLGRNPVSSSWQLFPSAVCHNLFKVCSALFFPPNRYTKMKTATNIYIFNLALADALATSTLPFQSAKYLMSTWPFGELLCKVVIAIDYYNMFTSIFTLTMMSVDRYIAVCHPVKALDFRTPAKAKLINVAIWILSSAIGVPVMIMAVTKVTEEGEGIFIAAVKKKRGAGKYYCSVKTYWLFKRKNKTDVWVVLLISVSLSFFY